MTDFDHPRTLTSSTVDPQSQVRTSSSTTKRRLFLFDGKAPLLKAKPTATELMPLMTNTSPPKKTDFPTVMAAVEANNMNLAHIPA